MNKSFMVGLAKVDITPEKVIGSRQFLSPYLETKRPVICKGSCYRYG